MVPYISDVLFDEPQGRPNSLIQFGLSLTFLCIFVYAWSVGDVGDVLWVLFLIVGTALSGIAESLPKNRRQAAVVLRFAGILVLLILLLSVFLRFDFLIGG
ncbi:hypothetical protein C477_14388 [Haloterrigena salina JCM 13891]|uniref:Uncharacterized protein n=1 Tax=Haloterrigena salina JCM 13891 TaxID=1227488 RepID=M0C4E5_9EURY|nr:hypothetical protein [Haloterrigena salina]ELZ16809.1 hypothetical protein C477_14388 [Haloterrigena salina JCM 13891]